MDRIKKIKLLACGLAFLAGASAWARTSSAIGVITQVHGEPSYFSSIGIESTPRPLRVNEPFLTEGSFLNDEATYFTARISKDNWLRLNPNSKLDASLDEATGVLTINLFSGSFKGLFRIRPNQGTVKKVIIQAGDARLETTRGKFSVVRNRVFDDTGLFVEKGSVIFSSVRESNKDSVYVHAGETARLADRTKAISAPRKMSPKELKFLKDSNYLKGLK